MSAKSRLELIAERKEEQRRIAEARKPVEAVLRMLAECASDNLAHEMQSWRTAPLEDSSAWAARMDWNAYSLEWVSQRIEPAMRALGDLLDERGLTFDDLNYTDSRDNLRDRQECVKWMGANVRPLLGKEKIRDRASEVAAEIGAVLAGDRKHWKHYHYFFGALKVSVGRALDGLGQPAGQAPGATSPDREERRLTDSGAGPTPEAELTGELAGVVPYEADSPEWVTSKVAARMLGVRVKSLGTRRTEGKKGLGPDGHHGVDPYGRVFWSKGRGLAWYYRPTLKGKT